MTQDELQVTHKVAFEFFLGHLKEVTWRRQPPEDELKYNGSLLTHFATTSTGSRDTFPACPTSLTKVFDQFVMDRSGHLSPDIMEAAAAQCLLLTGFFHNQQKHAHPINWYAGLGMSFYMRAASTGRDRSRARLMERMSKRFEFWRVQHKRLASALKREADEMLRLRGIQLD